MTRTPQTAPPSRPEELPLPPGYMRAQPPVPPAPDWWIRLYGPTGQGDPIEEAS